MDLSNVNWGRFALSWIAAVVSVAAAEFVVHSVVLMSTYEAHWQFGRPPEEMPFLPFVANWVIWGFLFVLIYTFGIHPGKPGWRQGISYGILMGLFFWIPYALVNYAVLPIPALFIGAWIGLGTIQFAVAGLVVGLIYRTKAQALLQGDS